MAAPAVVKAFDVTEDLALCFGSGLEEAVMYEFSLQGSEKRLGDGVVVTAPSAAHALNATGSLDQSLEPFAAILRAAI